MSHLGDLTSALVDGELTGAELDRVHSHLAACAACRAETAQVRRLKRELSALGEVDGAEALTRRLLAMPGPGTPLASRPLHRAQLPARRAGFPHGESPPAISPGLPPRLGVPRGMRARRRRGRYAVWGAVSLVVAGVGVGAAAFGMGGGGTTERQITPQLEMFDLQHAVTSGDVPFTGPPGASARAARP
jgi:anti-sigma factor RsiW